MKRGLAVYGGGNFIFYIAGVLNCLLERGLQFEAAASYSAGAALMPAIVSRRIVDAVNSYCDQMVDGSADGASSNWWGRSVSRDLTYSAILDLIYDFDSLQASETEVRVILATYECRMFCGCAVALGGLAALAAYNRSKRFAGQTALALFKKYAGLRADMIDMRTCNTRDEAIHIVQGTSTIYPFIKVRSHEGRDRVP